MYPRHGNRQRQPEIVIRTLHSNQVLLEFEIACLLGYWHHEHQRLSDPDAPEGTITLPRDPGVMALLHQYAIALLCLPEDCPTDWPCHCNEIRSRFNAPPPDHERPTATYELADIEQATQSRHLTDPQFPYRNSNPWTGDE